MIRQLSTNGKVWKLLFIIIALLTAGFGLLFFFRNIFLTIIIGTVMVLTTEKFLTDFNRGMARSKVSNVRKNIYGWVQITLWILMISVFMRNEITALGQLMDLASNQSASTEQIISRVMEHLPTFNGEPLVGAKMIAGLIDTFADWGRDMLSRLSLIIINGVLIIPLMFHIYFKRRQEISSNLRDRIPEKFKAAYDRAMADIGLQLHSFWAAKVTESIGVAAICYAGFYFAGVKGWFLLGSFAGIMNIVPYLGPVVGGLPGILAGFVIDDTAGMLALITVVIAQLIDNFYLIPFMISNKVKMDPLFGIILVLILAKLLGIFGMVFAVPIYIIYKVVLQNAYSVLVELYDNNNG